VGALPQSGGLIGEIALAQNGMGSGDNFWAGKIGQIPGLRILGGGVIEESMSLSLIFWIGMFVWLLFGLWSNWPVGPGTAKPLAGSVLLFILLLVLGWQVFGAPIHK
jgi:hypothetical protein